MTIDGPEPMYKVQYCVSGKTEIVTKRRLDEILRDEKANVFAVTIVEEQHA